MAKEKIEKVTAHIVVNAFYVAVIYGGMCVTARTVSLLFKLFGLA